MDAKHYVCPDYYDGKIFAKTQKFNDKTYVDVRRYFKPENEWISGPRGVNFTLEQWQEFLKHLDEICAALEKEEKYDLLIKESKIEVTVRQWRRPIQYVGLKSDRRLDPVHPKKMVGITFNTEGFKAFLEVIPLLNKEIGL